MHVSFVRDVLLDVLGIPIVGKWCMSKKVGGVAESTHACVNRVNGEAQA